MTLDFINQKLKKLQSLNPQNNGADWISLKSFHEVTHRHGVRNEKWDYHQSHIDHGFRIDVLVNGHFGYAGTSDISDEGLRQAFLKALTMTQQCSLHKVFTFSQQQRPPQKGSYQGPGIENTWDNNSWVELNRCLTQCNRAMQKHSTVHQRSAHATIIQSHYLDVSSNGNQIEQCYNVVGMDFRCVTQNDRDRQFRSWNGGGHYYQNSFDFFNLNHLLPAAEKTALEAIELLEAEQCPTDKLDLILAPDQMMLQIHESIGHPLEMDRILGDERNFAGWSFIRKEDFGKLQYGSPLMNVTFNPHLNHELANYAFDESGHKAEKQYLIKDGLLLRGLGSLESQERLQLPGVANFRSASWNRAPIDRMANINLEPGQNSLGELIEKVENGILMHSNRSWSIDDYRRKFQFGCEYAERIVDGRKVGVIKNPNYRGITVPFWQSLYMLSNDTEVYGTPTCGKGEPNQVIRVGHASPYALFKNIEVFGAST